MCLSYKGAFVFSLRGGSTSATIDYVALLIGWSGDSLSIRKAYILLLWFKRILGGGVADSTSIGSIGAVRNTPRIFLIAMFCRLCKSLMNCC